MLIYDSQNLPRVHANLQRDKKVDAMQQWVAEQTANAVYLKDEDMSPANVARQMGQQMSAVELEKKLLKLNPNLVFEVITENPTHRKAFELRRGEKHPLTIYPNGIIPEHSFMRVKEELVQDMDFYKETTGTFHLNRKDLPKHEFVPGEGYKWDGVPLGFKKTLIPYGEYLRGWRTVLVRLVEQGAITPTQAEMVFGADNRPEWANHMGKQSHARPW